MRFLIPFVVIACLLQAVASDSHVHRRTSDVSFEEQVQAMKDILLNSEDEGLVESLPPGTEPTTEMKVLKQNIDNSIQDIPEQMLDEDDLEMVDENNNPVNDGTVLKVIEGDMLMTFPAHESMNRMLMGASYGIGARKWETEEPIKYWFTKNTSQHFSDYDKTTIRDALQSLADAAGFVSFQEVSDSVYPSIKLIREDGCWSHVGFKGGIQELSLSGGCIVRGIIQHEFLHALGIVHEHSRADRGKFIEVVLENIEEKKQRHFKTCGTCPYHGTPYEYGSVMHYGAYAFTVGGKKTIIAPPDKVIGQRRGFTETDILALQRYYNDDRCQNNGIFDYDTNKCDCPDDNHYGDLCEKEHCLHDGQYNLYDDECYCSSTYSGDHCEIPRCIDITKRAELNGAFVLNPDTLKIELICEDGYEASHDMEPRCGVSSTGKFYWSMLPDCVEILCDGLNCGLHGELVEMDCECWCDDGWEGERCERQIKPCPRLSSVTVANGEWRTDWTTQKLYLHCDLGHIATNSNPICVSSVWKNVGTCEKNSCDGKYCQHDGQLDYDTCECDCSGLKWTGKYCHIEILEECATLQDVEHGQYNKVPNTKKYQLVCEDGYEPSHSQFTYCFQGVWYHEAVCQPKTVIDGCKPPPPLMLGQEKWWHYENGQRVTGCKTSEGSECRNWCNIPYHQAGGYHRHDTMICRKGEWVAKDGVHLPVCELFCNFNSEVFLKKPEHFQKWTISGSYPKSGTRVGLVCQLGFEESPAAVCDGNTKLWKNIPLKCTPTQAGCPECDILYHREACLPGTNVCGKCLSGYRDDHTDANSECAAVTIKDTDVLMAFAADWKYQMGKITGSGWLGPTYSDHTWKIGAIPIGHTTRALPLFSTDIDPKDPNFETGMNLRLKFELSSSLAKDLVDEDLILKVSADNGADVWLNGHKILEDAASNHNPYHWNNHIAVPFAYLNVDKVNVLAVFVSNTYGSSDIGFDVEMRAHYMHEKFSFNGGSDCNVADCAMCENNVCSICDPDFLLFNGVCVTDCPDGSSEEGSCCVQKKGYKLYIYGGAGILGVGCVVAAVVTMRRRGKNKKNDTFRSIQGH